MKKATLTGMRVLLMIGLLTCIMVPAFAQSAGPGPLPKFDTGDTAWMQTSTLLVLLMTVPGLALFYGGLVRSKNILSVMMQSYVATGIITVQWCLFGYSLAFGAGQGATAPFVGDFSYALMHGVDAFRANSLAPTIPHQLFCMFQLMFAIITPALISGAIVERMKFSAYCVFMLLWATFVYDPLAHMVWGGGWLGTHGALDFAGGSVVHMSSGFSALVLAMMLGRRKRSEGGEELRPHNLPFTMIGAGLLWVGWFGFNAGSACGSNQLAVTAFTSTHVATATAGLVWMAWDWIVYKKPTALGFSSGLVAGLVAITPACGFVTPMGGAIIGAIVASVCFFTIKIKHAIKADDALDVFGIHGMGGLTGCLCTGLFTVSALNPAIAKHNGLFNGGTFAESMVPQLLDAGVTILMAVVGTIVLALITKVICGGLRSADEQEETGLDITDHGEAGYSTEGGGSIFAPSFATAE
ncbi:MAG TPA: ammonium transporter [Capsulimonadaceae bacterium]|jgi:Amt family ammonium transporter